MCLTCTCVQDVVLQPHLVQARVDAAGRQAGRPELDTTQQIVMYCILGARDIDVAEGLMTDPRADSGTYRMEIVVPHARLVWCALAEAKDLHRSWFSQAAMRWQAAKLVGGQHCRLGR